MSRRVIRWRKRALRRLDQIGAHITKDNPAAAARVVARIVSAADALAENAALGRVGRVTGTRELVLAKIPYIIAYRVAENDIEILTVMHTAQRWPKQL
jgi:addiction module RelE/StbE family toxin